MAISFKKYIDITSGVGGSAGVRERDLITRLFTSNELVPPQSFVEMGNIEDVANYFGSGSAEYKRAVFYFGWISKNISRAKKISFARFVKENSAAQIFGAKASYKLDELKKISSGALSLTLGATKEITGIDYSTADSLTAVASITQAAINAMAEQAFVKAKVSYDAVTQRFVLKAGEEKDLIVAATGEIAEALGFTSEAIFADGALAETVTDTLIASADASNNFASFLFMDELTNEQLVEVAQYNDAQNVMYMHLVAVTSENAKELSETLIGYSGTTLTLVKQANQFDEMIPGIILAASDYSKRNAAQNYMFQQFPELTAKVSTTELANKYDTLRVNYYGQTQTAGQNISFYQRGVMMGGASDLVDQNVYANEAWLKDSAAAQIMSLLLSVSRVPANANGRAQLLAVLQSVIDKALYNGCISVGKSLTVIQKTYIAEITGNDLAWQQVQNSGYWLDCQMQTVVTEDGRTEYKAVYTLIYSKDDAVRKVEGTHTLI